MISKELRDRHMRMCQKFMMLRLDSLFSDLPRGEFMPLQTIYAYSLRNPGTKGIYVSELASQLKVSSPAVSRTLRWRQKVTSNAPRIKTTGAAH